MTEFEYNDATRTRVPLLVSCVGPSYSGKTFSALRMATGMQKVTGGDIAVIDTENMRATHYSDRFAFKHVPFDAPFSPMRYLEALEVCVAKGARIVIVDSGSHCWEGTGGVLEQHEMELDRMAGSDWKKRDKANFAAWIKPKQSYTKLVNRMLQLPIHMIWCFRAKEKVEIRRGQDPVDLGFMSIAGKEMMYEFVLQALLYPGSNGVPEWSPKKPGERMMAKLPAQFANVFKAGDALSENHGVQLAQWAEGTDERPTDADVAVVTKLLDACETKAEVTNIAAQHRNAKPWTPEQRATLKEKIDERLAVFKVSSGSGSGSGDGGEQQSLGDDAA